MLPSETIGYAAAFLTTVAFLPQALHTIRTRDTKGISLGMYVEPISKSSMSRVCGQNRMRARRATQVVANATNQGVRCRERCRFWPKPCGTRFCGRIRSVIGFTKTASLGISLFLGLRPQTQRRGHEGF